MKLLLSLFTLLLAVTACDSTKKTIDSNQKMQKEETLSGTYFITHVGNNDVSKHKLAITFDESTNQFSGFAGCNQFFGAYSIDNNSLLLNNVGASKKLCHGDAMTIEDHILKALGIVDSFSIDDSILSLSGKSTILIKASKAEMVSQRPAAKSNTSGTSIKYQALTRGSFDFILISSSEIITSNDQSLQKLDKHSINQKDWDGLNALIEKVDLETFQNLNVPSTQHQFDGAAHATLAIQIGDIEYMSPTFDHGNPPTEIDALVNKVLSIKENTLKQ
ncbi:heat shock protein HslJ [Winogradskyella epiphytica]|uniref:Heat shock protein HslJ n=1 Tax=Winogradskyella epiphytica TaxID=262005 RepID=A0A2V4X163_9FLAO|nr:META domain-containing protein [Winogradskyella epiphytica]PYE83418.1 heat shock protein HslJ [Winogradskyella epiphytica]GGW58017.1 hypothetical protein GCM10008085_07110 [Winogradskyella epiphytica]